MNPNYNARELPETQSDLTYKLNPDTPRPELVVTEPETVIAETPEEHEHNIEVIEQAATLSKGLRGRLKEDAVTLFGEVSEKGYRTRRIAAVVGGIATQAIDRSRAMIFAVPFAFDHALTYAAEHGLNGYQTGGLAGAAVGTTFAGWTALVGKSFQTTIKNLPETTEKITENHPAMVDVITDATGGFVDKETLAKQTVPKGEYEVGPYDARSSKLGKAALALSRGIKTVFVFGSTAYVGVSKTKGYSDKSTNKIIRAVTAESYAVTGGLALTVSALVTHNSFGAAQEIREAVTNKPAMLALGVLIVGYSALDNFFKRRKAKNSLEAEALEAAKIEEAQLKAQDAAKATFAEIQRRIGIVEN